MTNSQKSFVACALLLAMSLATVFSQTRRGYDPSSMDKNTSVCTDFYQYANGTWLKNTEIPAAYSSWGAFNVLAENNRMALHQILEEAAKKANATKGSESEARKIALVKVIRFERLRACVAFAGETPAVPAGSCSQPITQ